MGRAQDFFVKKKHEILRLDKIVIKVIFEVAFWYNAMCVHVFVCVCVSDGTVSTWSLMVITLLATCTSLRYIYM